MAARQSAEGDAGDRMIQGRIWSQRVPRQQIRPEAAEERYRWWSRLYPGLFNPRRSAGTAVPQDIGKGCVACLMDNA